MGRWHNFATHEEWVEFVQNPNTSSTNVQTNEIITNCQNNICTADVHNPDREEDTKGLSVFPVKMLYILDEDLISINMLN